MSGADQLAAGGLRGRRGDFLQARTDVAAQVGVRD